MKRRNFKRTGKLTTEQKFRNFLRKEIKSVLKEETGLENVSKNEIEADWFLEYDNAETFVDEVGIEVPQSLFDDVKGTRVDLAGAGLDERDVYDHLDGESASINLFKKYFPEVDTGGKKYFSFYPVNYNRPDASEDWINVLFSNDPKLLELFVGSY